MTHAPGKRVLLVYSRVGGGHLSAARALAEGLEATGRVTTRLVDAYLECGRFPVTLFPAAYAQMARFHPWLWSVLYRRTEAGLDVARLLSPFLRDGLRRAVARERPDLVVSTLPVINGFLTTAAMRVEVVLTDWHSVHPFWVAPGVEHYTAPTESARDDCIRLGARPHAVDVVGIPVMRAFAQPMDRNVVRTRLLSDVGMDPRRFTILAMVGAEGSPKALRNIARLAQLALPNSQLLVVCGRNRQLRRIVQRLPARMPVRALGFVDYVADLMRSADVLVTKAGGLTLAEAFCSGIPVVVQDVLPGQESGNLEYVLARGAVAYGPDPSQLTEIIVGLHGDAARRAQLADRGRALARPDAAQTITRNLLERLQS